MIESVVFNVGILGKFPTRRSDGREGRGALDDIVTNTGRSDLTIDFANVTAMTFSFADEFLGKFVSTLDAANQDVTLKVTGLNIENAEAVSLVLERRETQVVILGADGTLKLDGSPILAEAFEAALVLGEFKASDLAQRLGTTPQNANNKLKRLTAVGALRKARTAGAPRGGKEFSYTAVTAAVP
jgi:hypothetical protein